jgi:hypothetical protein
MVEEALRTGSIAAVAVLLPVTAALLRTPVDAPAGAPVAANGSGGAHTDGSGRRAVSGIASVGRRLTSAAHNQQLWLAVFALTLVLVAVLNAAGFGLVAIPALTGLLPTAGIASLSYLVMTVGTYAAVSARTTGNAMAVGACALAIGLVLLVAVSGHLLLLEGSGPSPVN